VNRWERRNECGFLPLSEKMRDFLALTRRMQLISFAVLQTLKSYKKEKISVHFK